MLGDINWNLKPRKLDLFLCLPNGQTITKLSEAYGVQWNPRLGNLGELTFNIPYQVDRQHMLVDNKNINLLKERYIVKAVSGLEEERFIINKISDSDSGSEYKSAHCWLLPYELNDKKFRSYKRDAINATTALTDATSTSIWAVGTVDPDFDTVYRSFDFSSITALDFVFKIAETFKALIQWDTKSRLINLVKPESVGQNKGLKISYGKYLKSIGREVSTDELVTKLSVYGSGGLSINRVNPTGTSYLLDFSAFLFPFQRDANRNVIQSSDYMSDSLCHAILDYDDLVASKQGEFSTYITEKETLQTTLTTKENEMSTLETEMWTIEDSLVVAKASGDDTTLLEQQKANKQTEIDAKQSEIDLVITDIEAVEANIETLQFELAIENNFTPDQIKERNMFIIESEWSDDNYIDDQMLYDDAIKFFEILKQPQTVINMDIVNFLNVIEEQRNWDKLSLGDTITIQHERLGIDVQARIIEIQFDYDSESIRLTIANVKDIQTDKEKFIKSLYRSISTSTSVDMNKYKWDLVSEVDATLNDYMSSAMDATKQAIIAGTNESVKIDRRGLTITNPDDPTKMIIANHSVVALSRDSGETWETAISASGIHAPVIIGDLLISSELRILNESGKFTFDQNGATLIDADLTLTNLKNSITLNPSVGFDITRLSDNAKVFSIDVATGNIHMTGSITMTGGTISWTDVNTPTASQVGAVSTNDGRLTELTPEGIYTGTITFDQGYGGILTLGGQNNDNGVLRVLDNNSELVAELNALTGGFEWLRIGNVISDSVVKTNSLDYSIFVDPLNGNDLTGDGLTWVTAYKTIQKALNSIPKYNEGIVTIWLHIDNSRNITENITIEGFTGGGHIELDFQSALNTLNGKIDIRGNTNRIRIFDGTLNVANTTYAGIYLHLTKLVDIERTIIYGNNSCDFGVSVNDASVLQIIDAEIYDVNSVCIRSAQGSSVYIKNCKGLAPYGIQADIVGTIGGEGTAPAGSVNDTRAISGGEIRNTFTPDSGLATPPTPPSTTTTWTSTSADNWSSSGYWGGDGAKQGNWGYGRRTGYWFFPSDLSTTVTGKTVNRIRVFVKRSNKGGSSGNVTIHLRWHTYTSRPASASNMAGMGSETKTVDLAWGESAWVELPSSFYDDFASGNAKGIGIYVASDSSSDYAVMDGQAKLEITYA